MDATKLTIKELLQVMNHGFIREEIKAASAEYWRRVESGEHKQPAPVETLGAKESDRAWHAKQVKKLG